MHWIQLKPRLLQLINAINGAKGADEIRCRPAERSTPAAAKDKDNVTTQDNLTPQEIERRKKMQAEIDRLNAEAQKWAAEQAQAKTDADKAQLEAFEKARAERLETEMKTAAMKIWGGTQEEFEQQWPSLRVELLRDRVRKDADVARDNFGKMVQSFF
jgi:hypothetical protein